MQINEDNARVSYGYSKGVLERDRKNKPNQITWSDEIQVKLNRRSLKIDNRRNEPKWISKNMTIMDYVSQYIEVEGLKNETNTPGT